MFRRILFLFVLLAYALHTLGNPKANELRKSMYQAPDSARAAILFTIAQLFRDENVDSCIYYAQRAYDKAYSLRQYLAVLDAQKLMSQIAVEKRDFIKATAHQTIIRDLSLRERLWDRAMENYNDMAQTWLLRNNYAEAVEFLKKGMEIAVDRNHLELQKYFYQALVDSYRRLGRVNDVYAYYSLLKDVELQILANSNNDLISAMQKEHEVLRDAAEEAKNRWQQRSTISKVFHITAVVWAVLVSALLAMAYIWFTFKYKPDIIKKQNEARMKAEERDLLTKNQENAFRFLSNQVHTGIGSLTQSINLFEAEQGNLPMAADSLLNTITNKIRALYGFFQNFSLLLQAQSGQLKPVLTTINIPQLTHNLLVEYELNAITKNIRLTNDVQNNIFAIADERLIEIVLRNLISNAFKFVPEETGNISIGAKIGTKVAEGDGNTDDVEFVEIWVTDDGIGLLPEQAEILFDLTDNLLLPGDPGTKGYGAGLAVCKAVIELLRGRIWVETKPDEGFCIRFNLPRTKGLEVNTLSLAENNQDVISAEDTPTLLLSE